MKIRAKMLANLCNKGLFEEQAKKIMESYEQSPMGQPMKGRMDDDEEGYPPVVLATTWAGVKHTALQWIDENAPQHWARPMFVN